MTARERVLALKLLEMEKRTPEYAKRIGIQVRMVRTGPKKQDSTPVLAERKG